MEINRAAELLRALADGIDPMTGQPLPDESVYNRPEIIRALHCVLQALQERHGRSVGAIETRLSELGQRDQIQFSMR